MGNDYYRSCALPKPEPRKKVKARAKRRKRTHVDEVRAYVFGRERNICRCCRLREAHSMHELRFKSLGGKVSKQNSIAVCGSGTTLCHGFLQRNEIIYEFHHPQFGAESTIDFTPRTTRAAMHLRIASGTFVESPVMAETEIAR